MSIILHFLVFVKGFLEKSLIALTFIRIFSHCLTFFTKSVIINTAENSAAAEFSKYSRGANQMALKCNLKLKKLADESQIVNSVIPVLICDENLFVCTKSIGAERLFKDIRPKHRITDRFTSDALKIFEDYTQNNFFTTFLCDDSYSAVMVSRGCALGENYIALIFRPKYVFSGNVPKKLLNESLDSVAEVLTQILTHKTDSQTELKHRCLQLSRVCSIYGDIAAPAPISISEFMDSFAANCEAAIPLLGMSVKSSLDKPVPLTTEIPLEFLQITAATIVVTMLSVTNSGILELGCTKSVDGNYAEITVSAEPSLGNLTNISDFVGLMEAPIPTKLELLSLADLAPKMDIKLRCFSDHGKLTVSAQIPISNAQSAKMSASENAAALLFKDLIRDMYEYMDACRKI